MNSIAPGRAANRVGSFRRLWGILSVLLAAALAITSCSPVSPPEEEATLIVFATPEGEETPIRVTVKPARPDELQREDTLVICMGSEADTLYPYGGSMLAASVIQDAIWDGPIDNVSFGYQAVILEKMPSLADGDAVIQAVTLSEGDIFSNVFQDVGVLEEGLHYLPSGCNSDACAVEYTGGEVVMDQMRVTFKLLPGLTWSDGEPLTAYDSVYSYELWSNPYNPGGHQYDYRVQSYEALDELTVQWVGLPGFLDQTYFLNFWQPLPEHIWGEYTSSELVEAEISSRTPMGWGPYILDEWVNGEAVYAHRNPNYFRAEEGLPHFEYLVFKFTGENSNANIAALLSGECDVADQGAHLDDISDLLLTLQDAGQVAAHFVTGTVFEHADFGINPVSYDDGYDPAVDRPDFFGYVRTRQAIAMCMDRQAVVDVVMFGQSVVIDSYLPPEHPLFNPRMARYPFDPAAGSALLDEVGWIDHDEIPATPRVALGIPGVLNGTLLEFYYWTTTATQRQEASQILAASLAECGVKANLEYWVSGEYFADFPDGPIFGRRFDMGQFAWLTGVEPPCDLWMTLGLPGEPDLTIGEVPWLAEAMGPDADLDAPAFPYGGGGWNNPGYANPEFDAACEAAMSQLPGQEGYEFYHWEAQRIFAEDLPIIPLYLRLKLAATRPDFCGFIMDPTANSEMWNIEEFGYGSHCD